MPFSPVPLPVATTPPGRGTPRPRPSTLLRPLLGLVLCVQVATSGCRFERRPDARNGNGVRAAADTGAAVTPAAGGATEDSLRAVVTAFHEALRVGDGSRVASLSVLGATIVDQEEGVRWRVDADAAGELPGALLPGLEGLGWERVGSEATVFDAAALVVDRYRAIVSGEAVPWTAVETFVFERTDAGWRIRHVHRSRGRVGGEPVGTPDRPDAPPAGAEGLRDDGRASDSGDGSDAGRGLPRGRAGPDRPGGVS